MPRARRLPRSFYARDTLAVAQELCGKYVSHEGRVGRIIEVEAYHGRDDQTSHARRGPTPRAAIMFGPPGVAYIYQIYGMFFCLNLVTMTDGFPAAVLIRALEPVAGLGDARTDGPGKLCRAMAIDKRHNGLDVTRPGALQVEDRGDPAPALRATPRVNVDYAGAWAARPWRWVVEGAPVSRPRWGRA